MLHERKISVPGESPTPTSNMGRTGTPPRSSPPTVKRTCTPSPPPSSHYQISSLRKQQSSVFVSHAALAPLMFLCAFLIGLQTHALFGNVRQPSQRISMMSHGGDRSSQMAMYPGQQMQGDVQAAPECRWYLADSAIPNGGLGVHTAFGLNKDDMVGFPDICIFVADAPEKQTKHLHSHSYGGGMFFGHNEGKDNRAACEGFVTLFNSGPKSILNSEIVSATVQSNANLHRATSPGAGAITHHYGVTAKALDVISPGAELTVDYWDWDYPDDFVRPVRGVQWLQENGWCIDNMFVAISLIPDAGRGAFARRPVPMGDTVGPAPLQAFRDRTAFTKDNAEQLFVNYCLQPPDSTILFFPYGPMVNLINHASPGFTANVAWRWSTQTNSTRHDSKLLDPNLPIKAFLDTMDPSMLVLEVYALRDIAIGEELLLDYGADWQAAWNQHVANWKPLPDADKYVYPMEMDETGIVRTVKEQVKEPYAKNLGFVCATSRRERDSDEDKNILEWSVPVNYSWWESMTACQVLDRKYDKKSDAYFYTVEIVDSDKASAFRFNPKTPAKDRIIDKKVPRRAIRFIEVPYMDDEHMDGVFRHPLELPDHLVPPVWKNKLS